MNELPVDNVMVLEESAPTPSRHYANAMSALFLFGARLLVAVLQLRLVDKYWGGGYTGLNALSNQVQLYVTLLELGLSQSAITLMYEPVLTRDHARTSALVSAVRHDVRLLAFLGAGIVLPMLAFYAGFIHGHLDYWTVAGTLGCIAIAGIVQLASIHFQVYLNAAERLDRVNFTLAGGYLIKTAVGLPLAIHWHNYLLLPATIAALTLGEFLCLKLAFHHSFPEFRKGPWREAAHSIRSRAKFVVIHKVAGLAYYQSDFIILSLTTSLVVVKDYAKFQYVAAALLSLVGLVSTSLTTSIARLQIRHEADDRRQQYRTAQFAISLIGGVLMLGFWFTSSTVVALVFGQDAAIDRRSILLFGIALFLNIVKAVDDVFIMAKGAFDVGYWIPVIEVPIYLVTGVLLSRRIGFIGILLASIITNLVVSILLKGFVLARQVFDSTRKQWYANRLGSMAKALLLIAPVAGGYALTTSYVRSPWLQFLSANLLALVYLLASIRLILSRGLGTGAAA
jgi:O-antigen/teichoic acid export membrane protein